MLFVFIYCSLWSYFAKYILSIYSRSSFYHTTHHRRLCVVSYNIIPPNWILFLSSCTFKSRIIVENFLWLNPFSNLKYIQLASNFLNSTFYLDLLDKIGGNSHFMKSFQNLVRMLLLFSQNFRKEALNFHKSGLGGRAWFNNKLIVLFYV